MHNEKTERRDSLEHMHPETTEKRKGIGRRVCVCRMRREPRKGRERERAVGERVQDEESKSRASQTKGKSVAHRVSGVRRGRKKQG